MAPKKQEVVLTDAQQRDAAESARRKQGAIDAGVRFFGLCASLHCTTG